MTVAATEERAPGGIVDADGRQAVGIATGQGKNLQFAPISTAASGATQLVAAQGGALKIKVVSYVLVASSAVTVKFQQGSTDVTGAMSLAANGGIVVASVAHMFETAANAALNINLGGAVQVSGHIAYFVE